jgi:4-diphosphocytidyl-2C-methyl-D-erythritol kinase
MESVQLRELTADEIDEVAGGISADTAWGVSTGTAAALGIGATVVAAPFTAAILAGASIISSGLAIYYVLSE